MHDFKNAMFVTLLMNYNPMRTFIRGMMLPKYFLAKIFVKVIRPSSYHNHTSDVPRSLTVSAQYSFSFFISWKLQ